MGSGIDREIVLEYYQSLSNEGLVALLKAGLNGLTMDAREIVKAELRHRNLDASLLEGAKGLEELEHVPSKVFDPEACPVDEPDRIWIDENFRLLVELFGKPSIKRRKVLLPRRTDFPVRYDGLEPAAFETLAILARQMDLDTGNIELDFYEEEATSISAGYMSMLYWDENEPDHFVISLATKLLDRSEELVAAMAHQLAIIKLSERMSMDDMEMALADLATIIFGLGVFNANMALHSVYDGKWKQYATGGFLSQMEWGYAFALFAYLRGEEDPEWLNELSGNIQGDFRRSQLFMKNNPHLVSLSF